MRKKILIAKKLIAAISALIFFGAGLQIAAQSNAEERAAIFEEVWNTINEKYYDAKFNGIDWRATGKKYRARLKTVSGDRDFYLLLDQMASELRDSHTRVFSPARREERIKQKHTSIGITIKEVEKTIVVSGVAADSEAARSGIKPGMIVHSVNGRPVEKVIRQAKLNVGVSSSERSTQMRVFSKLLNGEPGTFLKIGLLNENGKLQNFTLKRSPVSSAPTVSARILQSGIAYFKFSGFDQSIEREITQGLKSFKDAPALIIDLRGNAGGDGEVGLRFAGHFFDEKINVARIITRTGKPPFPGMPMTLEAGSKDGQIFSKPLAVLIDEKTASTAELIAGVFQESGRAKIFGTNSCGCVLAFLDYKPLRGGGDMTLSEFGFITAKGKTLEGKGILPDKIVPFKLKNLQNNFDETLKQAEEFLVNLNL